MDHKKKHHERKVAKKIIGAATVGTLLFTDFNYAVPLPVNAAGYVIDTTNLATNEYLANIQLSNWDGKSKVLITLQELFDAFKYDAYSSYFNVYNWVNQEIKLSNIDNEQTTDGLWITPVEDGDFTLVMGFKWDPWYPDNTYAKWIINLTINDTSNSESDELEPTPEPQAVKVGKQGQVNSKTYDGSNKVADVEITYPTLEVEGMPESLQENFNKLFTNFSYGSKTNNGDVGKYDIHYDFNSEGYKELKKSYPEFTLPDEEELTSGLFGSAAIEKKEVEVSLGKIEGRIFDGTTDIGKLTQLPKFDGLIEKDAEQISWNEKELSYENKNVGSSLKKSDQVLSWGTANPKNYTFSKESESKSLLVQFTLSPLSLLSFPSLDVTDVNNLFTVGGITQAEGAKLALNTDSTSKSVSAVAELDHENDLHDEYSEEILDAGIVYTLYARNPKSKNLKELASNNTGEFDELEPDTTYYVGAKSLESQNFKEGKLFMKQVKTAPELTNGLLDPPAATYYQVSFNGNIPLGMTEPVEGLPEALMTDEFGEVTLLNEEPTLFGYTFTGWNTEADGTGADYQAEDRIDNLTGNLTLFAQWKAYSGLGQGSDLEPEPEPNLDPKPAPEPIPDPKPDLELPKAPKPDSDQSKPTAKTSQAVYRLHNSKTNEHLYTTDLNEYNSLMKQGWSGEGITFYAASSAAAGAVAVHRLFNPTTNQHVYSIDPAERTKLIATGWKDEGAAWYAYPESTEAASVPITRLYNPLTKQHLLSSDPQEVAVLVQSGWNEEGTIFYAENN